jgi:hypothetical protein
LWDRNALSRQISLSLGHLLMERSSSWPDEDIMPFHPTSYNYIILYEIMLW